MFVLALENSSCGAANEAAATKTDKQRPGESTLLERGGGRERERERDRERKGRERERKEGGSSTGDFNKLKL